MTATFELESCARVGHGSLAVTAKRVGARELEDALVIAIAEPRSNDLVRRNALESRCKFRTGGFALVHGPYDVVLANIYADIIQANVATLRDSLAPHGWYAFSGCAMQHAESTRAALLAAGLTVDEERVRGRWHTFVGRR